MRGHRLFSAFIHALVVVRLATAKHCGKSIRWQAKPAVLLPEHNATLAANRVMLQHVAHANLEGSSIDRCQQQQQYM